MLRSFSFGYYDFIAPEEGGEAVQNLGGSQKPVQRN